MPHRNADKIDEELKSTSIYCLFVHYYNKNGEFSGKSRNQHPNIRRNIVSKALMTISKLPNIKVNTIGINGKSLIDIDIDCSNISDPRYLIFEAFAHLQGMRHDFDYYMVIEDDILITKEVILNTICFDERNPISELFLPNRVEVKNDTISCIDTESIKGVTGKQKLYMERNLKEYINPHSGICILRKDKLIYALQRVNIEFRGLIVGGYMASAFANFHKPFTLFRVADGLDFHTVEHMDIYEAPKLSIISRIINRMHRLFRMRNP